MLLVGSSLSVTVRAADAYEMIKSSLPVMKAWEEDAPRSDETIAYIIFDGTRIALRKSGLIRINQPQRMPLIIPVSWTRNAIYKHVRNAIDVDHLCKIAPADVYEFLQTGKLPGDKASRSYRDLETSLLHYTDAARKRDRAFNRLRHDIHYPTCSRKQAAKRVAMEFQGQQTSVLQARIEHHMIGSRRGLLGIHRQIVHILWRHIVDRDKAAAALRAYGRKCTIAGYNRIVSSWNLPCGQNGERDRGISSLQHSHRSAFILHSAVMTAKSGTDIAEAIQATPSLLRQITGDNRLWRVIRNWSDPQLLPISRILSRMTDPKTTEEMRLKASAALDLLRQIASRDIWPASALSHLSWLDNKSVNLLIPFVPAFHAAAIAARKQKRLKSFLMSTCLVLDMLRHLDEEDYATLVRDARNATWNRLNERQEAWHKSMAEIRQLEQEAETRQPREWSRNAQWEPLLGRYVDDIGEAQELVSACDLDHESIRMNHCVDSYVPMCLSGLSRIFSLKSGDNYSTLEIRRRYGVWNVIQNYAYDNKSPSPILDTLAKSIVNAANKKERMRYREG